MANGWFNRGAYLAFIGYFRRASLATTFEVHLCTATTTPNPDHNDLSELSEIADGNGYARSTGFSLNPNSTDFDVATEDDSADKGFVQVKDVVWTASGGSLPADSVGARWAVLTTNGATAADKKLIAWWDLTSPRVVSVGQTLTLADLQLDGSTV
jgi:hypothetical protein